MDIEELKRAVAGEIDAAYPGLAELSRKLHDNPEIAFEVLESDNRVDEINRHNIRTVEDEIRRTPDDVDYFILLMGVYRQLERIADHATNIAEDVLYFINGEIVRHRGKWFAETRKH